MREILHELTSLLAAGRAVAYCRLVETRGSTPQKPGAAMLVLADGSQRGTLGGGCVEAEVKRRALVILDEGQAEISTFSLDSDYGWDDGLICGGRMQILIEPLRQPLTSDGYYGQLNRAWQTGAGCTEAIAFDVEKSGLPATACWLFDAQGRLLAQTRAPQPAVPTTIADRLVSLDSRPRPYAGHGVAYLPSLERCRLLIVGGGHVGQAVAAWATELDFDVWVFDDRAEYVTAERFPTAERRIAADFRELPSVPVTPDTYCLIVTRGHNHDEQALHHLIDRGARYVGMIGSHRKIKLIFDDLLAEGVSPESLSQVFAPVGIDIGSQTVPEIAVSIVAELVSHRNRRGLVPGRPEAVAVGPA